MLILLATLLIAPQELAPAREATVTLFQQTAPHWRLPCDQPAVRRQRVQFDITLDRQGRIVAGPTPVRPQFDDPDWREAYERARAALVDAAPFDVPRDYPGGAYRPTFVAEIACSASDEP